MTRAPAYRSFVTRYRENSQRKKDETSDELSGRYNPDKLQVGIAFLELLRAAPSQHVACKLSGIKESSVAGLAQQEWNGGNRGQQERSARRPEQGLVLIDISCEY